MLQTKAIRRFVITEKAPTRAFSWLKAATTSFIFKTLLRHFSVITILRMELFEALNYTSSFGSNHGASLQGSLYYPFTVSCTDQADYWLPTDHLVLHASHFTDHVARAAPVPRITIQSAQFSPLLRHTLRGNLRNMLVLKLPSLHCRNRETRLIRAHETGYCQ